MKQFYALLPAIITSHFLLAQNVGIGTATPNASVMIFYRRQRSCPAAMGQAGMVMGMYNNHINQWPI